MTEKPKHDGQSDKKPVEGPPDGQISDEDQKKHRYYYDDAHGYETYDPDSEDSDEDED